MATVVKDFKIKSGLIVEGTTGRINNFDILTKKQADQDFIIDLIGGETLVKSVGTNLSVDAEGELSLDLAGIVEDIAGTRLTTDGATINVDVDGIADDLTGSYDFATNSDVTSAVGTEATNRDSAIATAVTDLEAYADQAELDAVATANSYTDGEITTALSTAQGYANTAEANANDYTDTALLDYTTTANLDTTIDGYGYLKSADLTGYATETYVNDAVDALVDGAPGLLDTLNEIAAAINDDENYATTMTTALAGKQGTLTAGDNISIVSDTISVTGLDSGDISDFDTAALAATASAYDAAGAAATAEQNAKDYADALDTDDVSEGATNQYFTQTRARDSFSEGTGINIATGEISVDIGAFDSDDISEGAGNLYFTDGRAADAAAQLLTAANLTNITITGTGAGLTITAENGVADSDTDDLTEGTSNRYFTDERAVDALQGTDSMFSTVSIDEVALQVAATLSAPTAGVQTAYAWAKADYRSAEFLVKVAYSTHTEISKVLLTLDTSDNIAITEYGIVGTNGSAATVSAGISGTDVQLLVTTANNTSTVTVVGTLLV
jgi:hypothetical protein